MKYGRINLHIDYTKAGVDMEKVNAGSPITDLTGARRAGYEPHIDAYILDDQARKEKRKAVVICPGGGYCITSEREAEPIAMQYLAAGFQVFILWYSVKPAVFPMALMELAATVKIVREHEEEWNIDPNKISVLGFSAGGHLAGSLATMWHKGFLADSLDTAEEMIEPNGCILCYPVITSGEKAHRGSFDNLLAEKTPEYLELVSLEKQVDEFTPPTFIWSTWTDNAVPVDNSLLMAQALRQANVSCELHIFKEGQHGLALANRETLPENCEEKNAILPAVQEWMKLSINWLNSL